MGPMTSDESATASSAAVVKSPRIGTRPTSVAASASEATTSTSAAAAASAASAARIASISSSWARARLEQPSNRRHTATATYPHRSAVLIPAIDPTSRGNVPKVTDTVILKLRALARQPFDSVFVEPFPGRPLEHLSFD